MLEEQNTRKNLDTEDNAEDEFQGQSTISGSIINHHQ